MTSVLKVDNIQNSSGTSALSIDSSGRVTQPAKPAFFVYRKLSDQTNQDYSQNTKVTFDAKKFDTGGDFDLTNDKFVVPVTGIYHISWAVRMANIQAATQMFSSLYLNGAAHWGDSLYMYAGVEDPQGGASQTMTLSITIDLDAGDELEVYTRAVSDTASLIQYAGTFFSGHLVA